MLIIHLEEILINDEIEITNYMFPIGCLYRP